MLSLELGSSSSNDLPRTCGIPSHSHVPSSHPVWSGGALAWCLLIQKHIRHSTLVIRNSADLALAPQSKSAPRSQPPSTHPPSSASSGDFWPSPARNWSLVTKRMSRGCTSPRLVSDMCPENKDVISRVRRDHEPPSQAAVRCVRGIR
jgi:hypothetical protein